MRLFFLSMLSMPALIIAMASFAADTDEDGVLAPGEVAPLIVAHPAVCGCASVEARVEGEPAVLLSPSNDFTSEVSPGFELDFARWVCVQYNGLLHRSEPRGPEHAHGVDACLTRGWRS